MWTKWLLLIACCLRTLAVDGGFDDDPVNSSWSPNNIHHHQQQHSFQLPPQPPIILRHQHNHVRHHHEHHWGPFFEEELSGGTMALAVPLGGTVHLNCRVGMLHDKTVMWLRRSGERVNLLTVGQSTYSSDPRLAVKFQYPNNWRLHISPVQREDEGVYLCQVSTHPPRVLTTNVTVLAPDLKVVDELGHSVHDRYYKTGSTIELTCRVMTSVNTSASHVTWLKDAGELPDKIRKPVKSQPKVGVLTSRLVILEADKEDSGNYSCSLSKQSSVHVHVHVLNGEKHAAVQHDTWDSGSNPQGQPLTFTLLVCAALVVH